MTARPLPDTGCPSCYRAELTPWQRLRRDWFPRPADVLADNGRWRAMVWGAYLGTTWYERHKSDFERTGETQHLDRMLRHVTQP